jgi:Putative zinc-finger
MNCAEVEIRISEYVDAASAAGERAEVERHLAQCASCAEMARDAAAAVRFMERAEAVEPPPELISHMLFDPPWRRQRSGWFARVFHPLLQPRFAMGMALTVLSVAMIMPKMGGIKPADLSPAAVWAGIEGRVDRFWARTEKFYDNLKFIYQIRATLREWQQQSQETRSASGIGVSGGRAEKAPAQQRQVPGPEGSPGQGPVGKP